MKDLKEIGFYSMYNDRIVNVSATSQMKRCEMVITERCNFKCPYCRGLKNEIYGERNNRRLYLDEIKRNIDYWCQHGPVENIRFSGGEPTMHPDIREAIDYTKKSGAKKIAISTNGSRKFEMYRELIDLGVNDFSISLDACCAEDVEKMSGGVKGAFDRIIPNIIELSRLTYVTVGIVLTPENVDNLEETVRFADSLGVSDIRIISAAQWNKILDGVGRLDQRLLNRHPILKYRVRNFLSGRNVRGMTEQDSSKCALIMDDSVIAGDYHFPCVIYMREGGDPVGKVGPDMRDKRVEWVESHNCYEDPICRNNCLDVCIDYNNKFRELRGC